MKYILSVLLIEWLINKALDLLFDYIAIKVKSFLEKNRISTLIASRTAGVIDYEQSIEVLGWTEN
ncbi:hypothetical protein S100333_04423 (plasmid) [Bacillus subtilis subsp. subtilis]|uniref:hypothetical protein n=1 Tax=Bacillus subtilis TaxID=1423 RepID=UPI000B4AEB1E|nr:hypothetical protein [Bacillus subtilis]ASB72282.1 hypothetical protein S100333_04423 [Bacillus subtilis subsp. subtilis]